MRFSGDWLIAHRSLLKCSSACAAATAAKVWPPKAIWVLNPGRSYPSARLSKPDRTRGAGLVKHKTPLAKLAE